MSDRPFQTHTLDATLITALDRVAQQVGNTPILPLRRIFQHKTVEIFAKIEFEQLGTSVKSRAAFQIIKTAIESGQLHRGKRILDATSGNTGIAYGAIASALGIGVTLCLPENASEERKNLLQALGVELILTSRFEGTDGAQLVAREMALSRPDLYYYADQYSNDANWQAHYFSTAPEIWRQTGGRITHFVAGLGTTGTFTGTGRGLLAFSPEIQLVALHPDNPMHGIEGWKHLETAIVPRIFDANLAHKNLEISTPEAFDMVQKLLRTEGILVSPSAAANLVGAIRVAEELEKGVVVTTFADKRK